MTGGTFTRRAFLRAAAGAAAVAATGSACGSGSDRSEPSGAAAKRDASKGGRTLRIVQWSHYVPDYDAWFDNEYTNRWGEDHDVSVVVDHIPFQQMAGRADTEAAARGPHDIFGFIDPPTLFEDQFIDHREIVEEVEAKLGKMTPLCERSVRNPKTGKYVGFPEYWVANLTHYRVDLWDQILAGGQPGSWEDVLRAAPRLKAQGYPVGIAFSADADSAYSLFSLLHAHGASIQDEEARLTINRPATVEAVRMGAEIFKSGMTDQVLTWDGESNNRHLTSGKGSMILNAVSALRAVEGQDPDLAGRILLAPPPTGRQADEARGVYITAAYAIWGFSQNQEVAKQFLVDLALNYQEAFTRSLFYNLPAFPGAVPGLGNVVRNDARAKPPDKYALLVDAARWSTNLGHPGHANAAVAEIHEQYLVPQMFAGAARGELSAEDAVARAEAQMMPIFEKWRAKGKI
jgi:multiple sugar transport system substrate-binding protein